MSASRMSNIDFDFNQNRAAVRHKGRHLPRKYVCLSMAHRKMDFFRMH